MFCNIEFLFDLHGNDGVDSSVADNNDDERHEKYLTVDQAVIDIVPSVRGHTQQDQLSSVGAIVRGHHHHLWQVLKEVDGGALVELLGWMFQYSEYNSLGAGEDNGQQPGNNYHCSKRTKNSLKFIDTIFL